MFRFQSPLSLSKVPENEPPPVSPKGALMERVPRFQCLLEHLSQVLVKVLIK
jgi:hypothetical protein